MHAEVNGNANGLPNWLDNITLEKAVKEQIGEFQRIVSVTPEHANKLAENYSSQMIRLNIEAILNDDSTKNTTFVLKTPHSNELMSVILNKLKLFQKEEQMYQIILPRFEKLYAEAGKTIQFAPKAYRFDRDIGIDYVLLEDLRLKSFKTGNCLLGLDLEHMLTALTKLAEFHAASACYVEHYGMFGEEFTVGVFSESNRELLKKFNSSHLFLTQLKKWKNAQKYYDKLADSDDYLVDRLLEDQTYNAREFNVLNHGDCWSNNIMFQYDAFGKIKQTLFVDLQVSKYGSPANDLYYLILSTAAQNIKLTQFDFMVRHYFDQLIENLKFLQYHRPLPKLKNIYSALLKNGLAAYMVVSKVLPLVMLDRTANANLENYMQDETKIKTAMFTNHKYVQAMGEILPWMDNRGLLDWK